MWLFNKGKRLGDVGFFDEFIDWHCHILPGVDDGFQNVEDSVEMLRAYEKAGVRRVWLTPHIMEECRNKPERLRKRFDELKEAYNGKVELRLAAEHMLDAYFLERLEEGTVMPIGEEGRHLLIETSYVNPPYGMEEMVEKVMQAGYTPILAHPERYRYMDENDYRFWKEKGLLFQTNFMSLAGLYGEEARHKAEWLLKEGMIDLTGSDFHRLSQYRKLRDTKLKTGDALDALLRVSKMPEVK